MCVDLQNQIYKTIEKNNVTAWWLILILLPLQNHSEKFAQLRLPTWKYACFVLLLVAPPSHMHTPCVVDRSSKILHWLRWQLGTTTLHNVQNWWWWCFVDDDDFQKIHKKKLQRKKKLKTEERICHISTDTVTTLLWHSNMAT